MVDGKRERCHFGPFVLARIICLDPRDDRELVGESAEDVNPSPERGDACFLARTHSQRRGLAPATAVEPIVPAACWAAGPQRAGNDDGEDFWVPAGRSAR